MTLDQLHFIIFLIHALARECGRQPAQVYVALKKSGCLDNYLLACYDVLHTLGEQYLVQNIKEYLAKVGVAI